MYLSLYPSLVLSLREPKPGELNQHIRPVDIKSQELQAAKEILGEVFGAGPQDVDEMIRARIGELKGRY